MIGPVIASPARPMQAHDRGFELRFQSLFDAGRALAFPCTASGEVDFDALSERAIRNYFVARANIGREFAVPQVLPSDPG